MEGRIEIENGDVNYYGGKGNAGTTKVMIVNILSVLILVTKLCSTPSILVLSWKSSFSSYHSSLVGSCKSVNLEHTSKPPQYMQNFRFAMTKASCWFRID
mmetsp:Transcript_9061/g.26912  ORF Transcript_9061/g.26912 Transcript_9061/m.26912 type:complete len:100 (-) Transcript_9061:3381-3680(-)